MSTIPALGRMRQENRELKASLGYIASVLIKKKEEKSGTYDGLEMGGW